MTAELPIVHVPTEEVLRTPTPSTGGVDLSVTYERYPPEVIQRIVRANYPHLRSCYASGLRASPNLQGRVTVSFAIEPDGTVSAALGEGDVAPQVTECVVTRFEELRFPRTVRRVTVTYPISLAPGA